MPADATSNLSLEPSAAAERPLIGSCWVGYSTPF
jgi:hypothetical protein